MSHLFSELKVIQEQDGYLKEDRLKELSKRRRVPLYTLQGVATFYPHFRLSPPPRLEVKVCRDFSCHLRGAKQTADAVEATCQARDDVTVSGVSCLGRCESPTAVALNDEIYTGADSASVVAMVEAALVEPTRPREERAQAPPFPGLSSGDAGGNFAVVREILANGSRDKVVDDLKASGLRGMGGAGFPTGIKWDLVRKTEGDTKYVIVNADESEPGTFKDRVTLEAHAERMIEGVVLAAWVIGAAKGWVFIRHEYYREKDHVAKAIENAREAGLLGDDILGTGLSFDIEIFESPGRYICGEETALLEAMEGKRAEPRNKPPFPGTDGLHGKPTLINNVETFSYIPAILHNGAEWFKSKGQNGGSGLKLLALSGHVEKPGVYEVSLGLPITELLTNQGGGILDGKPLKAIAPGGASSGFLPAAMADTPLDFAALAKVGSMLGSGAVVAIAEGTCMLDLALNVVRFFRDESCGKCVPCRVGAETIVEILERAARGEGKPEDLALIDDIAETMAETSICGLGQAAPYPITSVLKYWRQEVDDHILSRKCPSGACAVGSDS